MVWKIAIFDKYLALSRKWYNIWPKWTANRNLYAIYRMMLFPTTLSDLESLGEILNDTKHRAVSVRQLSFLFHIPYVFNALMGNPSEFRKIFSRPTGKFTRTSSICWRKHDDMLSRFEYRNVTSDRSTNGQNCYINIERQHCCADAR